MRKISVFLFASAAMITLVMASAPASAQFARAKAVLPPPPIAGVGNINQPGMSSPSEKLFEELEVVGISGNQALLRTEDRVYSIKNGDDLYLDGIKYRATIESARVKLSTEKSKDTFEDVLIITLGSAKAEKKESSSTGTASSAK